MYANPFLADFLPIFWGILDAKQIDIRKLELLIWDEDAGHEHLFEWTDVKDVLYQLGPNVNALTIYTNRPDYYSAFTEWMDEEQGLVVLVLSKEEGKRGHLVKNTHGERMMLDFEWNAIYDIRNLMIPYAYVPIHKKPWKMAENLDILVPFGYNTVIVKSKCTNDKKFVNDRFDEGFYRDELFYKEG